MANVMRTTNDELKDWEKFQRGREKFQRDAEGGLIGLLCSQTAHDQNVLGRCAQWETDSGYPPGGGTSELGGSIIMRVLSLTSPAGFAPHPV